VEKRAKQRRRLLPARPVLFAVGVAAFVIVVVVVLSAVEDRDGFSLIEGQTPGSYLAIFALVAADAVVPVFPGETTLNAGSTLASQGELSLWLVMLAGGPAPSWATRRCS
jgi:membrane-associated protein